MEVEFVALDKGSQQAEWSRQFLEDIPRWEMLVPPLSIHCDSTTAIGTAERVRYNGESRHI